MLVTVSLLTYKYCPTTKVSYLHKRFMRSATDLLFEALRRPARVLGPSAFRGSMVGTCALRITFCYDVNID
jgi:hypothetical protein